MTVLVEKLYLERCPHCSTSLPNLGMFSKIETQDYRKQRKRVWAGYSCAHCGGVVFAWSKGMGGPVFEVYPKTAPLSDAIPEKAKAYLSQAIDSISAPAGAVMLSASAVDEMLKRIGYTEGNLYSRIDKAVADNVLTVDMGVWAHEIRLDANDQRHSDIAAQLPTEADAERVVDFAKTLAQMLFVLPAQVKRGLSVAKDETENAPT